MEPENSGDGLHSGGGPEPSGPEPTASELVIAKETTLRTGHAWRTLCEALRYEYVFVEELSALDVRRVEGLEASNVTRSHRRRCSTSKPR